MKAHTRRPLFRAKGRTACQRFELRLPFQAFPNGVSAQPCSCISRRRFRPRWLPDASKMATSPRYCLQDIAFKMFALFYYVRLFLPSVLLPALFHYVRLFIPSPVSSPGHCSWMGWWCCELGTSPFAVESLGVKSFFALPIALLFGVSDPSWGSFWGDLRAHLDCLGALLGRLGVLLGGLGASWRDLAVLGLS